MNASTQRPMAPASEPGVEHVLCALCSSDAPVLYRRGMYRFEGRAFDLVRCATCGLVYVDPRPDGPSLARMYEDPEYFTQGYNLGVETENYFERAQELLVQYDGEVAELERETGGFTRLLELGSAGGFLLEAARRRGHQVRGVELSPVAARFAKEQLGLEIHEGWLEEAPFEPGSFDLAVADNVLEHTLSPRRTLRTLRRFLRPGGHLLVVVPSYVNSAWFRTLLGLRARLPRRLLGPGLLALLKMGPDPHAGPPYHVLEFDRRTLLRLLRESGFEIVSVQGSVPLPAEVFKGPRTPRTILLAAVFRALDGLMRARLLPPARLRVLAQRREA
jgi:SAM-dependent methyltransferase